MGHDAGQASGEAAPSPRALSRSHQASMMPTGRPARGALRRRAEEPGEGAAALGLVRCLRGRLRGRGAQPQQRGRRGQLRLDQLAAPGAGVVLLRAAEVHQQERVGGVEDEGAVVILGHAVAGLLCHQVHVEPHGERGHQRGDLRAGVHLPGAALPAVAKGHDLTVHLHLVEGLGVRVAMRAEAGGVGEVFLVLVDGIGVKEDCGSLGDLKALEFHVPLCLSQCELRRNVAVKPHGLRDASVCQAEGQQILQLQGPHGRTFSLLCQLGPHLCPHTLEECLVGIDVGHQPTDRHQLVPVGGQLQGEHELLETLQRLLVGLPSRQCEKLLEHGVLSLILLGVLHPVLVPLV
mmetsp:Transcript_110897/g.313701  ORF Transcript_110897/g.313701 Transcript_110897/m.313701 type:complete len:349 (-) Transcript_110897:783-1829(-)